MKLAKRRLELAAAIVALVLSVLCIVGMFVRMSHYGNGNTIGNIAIMICTFGIFITMLILSIIIIIPPKVINGVTSKRKGLKITFLVFASIYALSGFTVAVSTEFAFLMIPLVAPLTLIIISMCLSDGKNEIVNATQNATDDGFEGKIQELKHFKELEIIDEIEYKRAIEKLVEKII